MPFRLFPDGSVATDTLEEALAYQEARKPLKYAKKRPKNRTPGTNSGQLVGWGGFCKRIEGPGYARKILALIKGRGPPGITVDELAKATPASLAIVGGTLSGISKQAKKSGLNPLDVAMRRGRVWVPGPLLVENTMPPP